MPHILEGRSLINHLHGAPINEWRSYVFSEADYAWRAARLELGMKPDETRAFMVRSERWKYVHYEHFRPQLFDLLNDPKELKDLGTSKTHTSVMDEMENAAYSWLRNLKMRSTISNETVEKRTDKYKDKGMLFGVW